MSELMIIGGGVVVARCAYCNGTHGPLSLCGMGVELVGEPMPIVVEKEGEVEMTEEQILAKVVELRKELEELKGAPAAVPTSKTNGGNVKKNQKPGKPSATRKYVLLAKSLSTWGKVPRQQADIAQILLRSFQVGEEIPEAEVFAALVDAKPLYPSLAKSKQDPTYLFRYYRGLKKDATHAGFIGRNFLRML